MTIASHNRNEKADYEVVLRPSSWLCCFALCSRGRLSVNASTEFISREQTRTLMCTQ